MLILLLMGWRERTFFGRQNGKSRIARRWRWLTADDLDPAIEFPISPGTIGFGIGVFGKLSVARVRLAPHDLELAKRQRMSFLPVC